MFELAPWLSVTWTRTVELAVPSGNEHWNVPVFVVLLIDDDPPTSDPPVPQFGKPTANAQLVLSVSVIEKL